MTLYQLQQKMEALLHPLLAPGESFRFVLRETKYNAASGCSDDMLAYSDPSMKVEAQFWLKIYWISRVCGRKCYGSMKVQAGIFLNDDRAGIEKFQSRFSANMSYGKVYLERQFTRAAPPPR